MAFSTVPPPVRSQRRTAGQTPDPLLDLYPVSEPNVPETKLHYRALFALAYFLHKSLLSLDPARKIEIVGNVNLHAVFDAQGHLVSASEVGNVLQEQTRRSAPDLMVFLQPGTHPTAPAHRDDVLDSATAPHIANQDGVPDMVVEVLSSGTWENDVPPPEWPARPWLRGNKFVWYAWLGIRDYMILDPEGLWEANVPCRVYTLDSFAQYRLMDPVTQVVDGQGTPIWPTSLGLQIGLHPDADRYGTLVGIRPLDPRTGTWMRDAVDDILLIDAQKAQLSEKDIRIQEMADEIASLRRQLGQ